MPLPCPVTEREHIALIKHAYPGQTVTVDIDGAGYVLVDIPTNAWAGELLDSWHRCLDVACRATPNLFEQTNPNLGKALANELGTKVVWALIEAGIL